MRMILALAAVLYSAAALAQSGTPPAEAAKPAAAEAARPAKSEKTAAKSPAKGSIAVRLQACQDIEDGTKGRLDCYDEVIKPAPKPTNEAAKTVMQCKFTKEQDERLACYNGFVDSMPKLPRGG